MGENEGEGEAEEEEDEQEEEKEAEEEEEEEEDRGVEKDCWIGVQLSFIPQNRSPGRAEGCFSGN